MSIILREFNRYQVKIRVKGHNFGAFFDTKKEAEEWQAITLSEIKRGVFKNDSKAKNTKFFDLIDLYVERVLPQKKGQKKDISTCNMLKHEIANIPLTDLTTEFLSDLRDSLIAEGYSNGTIKKRFGMLSRLMQYAQIDLGIFLPQGLSVKEVKLPQVKDMRDRRLHDNELELLLKFASKSMRPVIRWALATSMRRKEIATLTWNQINHQKKYAQLFDTKNGSNRKVPLTNEAFTVLAEISETNPPAPNDLIFGYKSEQSITTAFVRATQKAEILDLNFHDLRHEATSRFFEAGLNLMEVAALTGHKDLQSLKRYTHLKPSDIADKLNKIAEK
jgi:integrase